MSKFLSLKTETSVVGVVGGGGVGGGIGVVLVVRELLVVRKRFFVLFNFSFFSFSCLWDKVFCCNLFHQGIVVLARWGL